MPPKIEVLDDGIEASGLKAPVSVSKPKKNPFATTKVKTERVDAKSVKDTSYRKGLNKPDYVRNTPLDLLFHDLELMIMHVPLEQVTLELLYKHTDTKDRQSLIAVLTDDLIKIQKYALERKAKDNQDLISISLHDIKTFSRLVNLIIIHGVYPVLESYSIGIPFAQRRLNGFTSLVTGAAKPIKIDRIRDAENGLEQFKTVKEDLLFLLFEKFYELFGSPAKKDDVRDLLLRGTGFSDFLTITLTLLTVPSISPETKSKVQLKYSKVISFPDTFELFQTFSLLMSSPSPNYFKQFVSQQIQTLHINAPRSDGILTLIEFVLGLRENEEVNIEKFDHVSNVILAKPKSIATVAYFTSVGAQLYELLININKPVVCSCVCYVLEKLWARNEFIVKDFVLNKIWHNFNPVESNSVSECELNNNINVIISLTKNNPSVSLLQAAFQPVLIYIWSAYFYMKKNGKQVGPLKSVFVSYFTIIKQQEEQQPPKEQESSVFNLDNIVKNLLCDGGSEWTYALGNNGLVEILARSNNALEPTKESKITLFLKDLDVATELFIELLSDLDDEFVHMEFIKILRRWLVTPQNEEILGQQDGVNPFFMLIDLRLLENIGEKFSDNLGKSPFEMLEIVNNFLDSTNTTHEPAIITAEVDSDDEDEPEEDKINSATLPILLQLLSAVLSESNSTDLDQKCFVLLEEIKNKLLAVSSQGPSDISIPASALHDRISELLKGDKTPPKSIHEQKVKLLKLAITSLNDPLVPIRAHGLHLLRQLVESKSDDVISLDFVIELHLNQLKDPEPFIYINVIKGLEQLIFWNESEVIPRYVNLYTANSEDKSNVLDLDERLRIGEVLLRYIQESNELFAGENAARVVEGALSLIRRDASKEPMDNRLRNSSMSILGVCCRTNPLGMVNSVASALDCALGILKLETSKDESVMRRAAIVLIHDLIIGTSNSPSLPFPEEYRNEVWDTLNYVESTDNDLLTREQAMATLTTIDELVKLAYEESSSAGDEKYKTLQII